MKEYTRLIGNIAALGFVLIIAAGYYMFHEMNETLLLNQKQKFQTEAEAKITIFSERINNISNNFNSFAKLPSFKSIRFHTLTLNHLAADDDRRHLELFLFETQKDNNYLNETRFIDDDGNEIIKVDRTTIHSDLANVNDDSNVSHLINLNLKAEKNHIDVIIDETGALKSLTWWVPVYVSSTKRLGYLAFNVDSELITREISDIADSGLNYILINKQSDNIVHDSYQLVSEPIPDNIKLDDNSWIVSEELPLSGLDWKINIIGNKALYTERIEATRSLVNYGIIPAAILLFVFLIYIYSKKIAADKHIHHLAYYDSLTGLVNRHQFDNALNNAINETREHNSQHALLYLDLDQFKIVNDTCGHLAGDKLLEALAAHLKQTVRDMDMLARLGGDEFALLLNLCPENKAISIANKLLTTVSDFRFVWKDKSFSIGVSIGVVLINNPDESASNILRKADLACYMAKELGRNRVHLYTDEDQSLEERHGEMQWVSRIKHAIDNNQFSLVAQYIMPLGENTASTQRYEILLRLNENGHVISPDAFIPAAERYGLMTNIDKWVIDHTFSFMEKLLGSPYEQNNTIVFSINVSGLSLGSKDFLPFIKQKLKHYKIPAKSICFEITETAAITNFATAMEFIRSIKELGCSLALDDFGSGLCSFSYLKTIPVDYLKIDGTFVTRMLDNSLDMAIVVAIKQISLATQSRVIAEFVTSAEIRDKLQDLGIDYAQGHGIAEPVPINHLFKLVDVNALKQPASKN